METLLIVRSDKIGDFSHFSLNESLVFLFLLSMQKSGFQGMLQASYKIFWWSCKEIATLAFVKAQDVVKTIIQKSIQRGETVQKKLP